MPPLLAVHPHGLGTPFVESLTSLVRRLAAVEARSVSDLLRWFVLDPIRSERGQRYRMFEPTRATEAINGAGNTTRLVVARISALTGINTVVQTTMMERDDVIEFREAFRGRRAWCPPCLVDDGPDAYDRLLWAFTFSRDCTVHGSRLIDHCGECRRSHRPWHRDASALHCPWCGSSFVGSSGKTSRARGRTTSQPATGPGDTSVVLRDLLKLLQTSKVDGATVAGAFAALTASKGGLRKTALALAAAPSELALIRRGRVRPHLELVIRAVLLASTAPSSLKAGAFFSPAAVPTLRPGRGGRPQHGSTLERRLRRRIDHAIEEWPPPSTRELARRLGTTPRSLRALFPALTRRVIARRRRWKRSGAADRKRRLQALVVSAVRRVTNSTWTSRRAVERLVGKPGIFRSPDARAALISAPTSRERPARSGGPRGVIPPAGSAHFSGQDDKCRSHNSPSYPPEGDPPWTPAASTSRRRFGAPPSRQRASNSSAV